MPSSPEYRDFVPLAPEVIAAGQAAAASGYRTTAATDATEEAAILALVSAMKAAHIDIWKVLLDGAVFPGTAFRARIEE